MGHERRGLTYFGFRKRGILLMNDSMNRGFGAGMNSRQCFVMLDAAEAALRAVESDYHHLDGMMEYLRDGCDGDADLCVMAIRRIRVKMDCIRAGMKRVEWRLT